MKLDEVIRLKDQDYLDQLRFEEIEDLIKRLRGGTGRMKSATVGEVIQGLEWMRNYCRGQAVPRSTRAWAEGAEIELGRLRAERRRLAIENDLLSRKLRRKNARSKRTNPLSRLFRRQSSPARRVSPHTPQLRSVSDNSGGVAV